MIITYQVSKTLVERLLTEYKELDTLLKLHPSDAAEQIKGYVHERMQHLDGLTRQPSLGDAASSDMRATVRGLKLELRAAQRNWKRHLVTEARLRRPKKTDRLSPDFAA